MARIAGGSSDIERKVREPQVANDPPWTYIIDDDKKQDAPIVISDDEDDDVVIISETHRGVCDYALSAGVVNGKARIIVVHMISKRSRSSRTDFELINFEFTRPRIAKICRMTRDEVPPLLTKISYT
jgi:hypothetical protein